MDLSTIGIVTPILASVVTQAVKREKAGTLENILGAGGIAYGASFLMGAIGQNADVVQTIVGAFAWHGLTGQQRPMKMLEFGAIDKLFAGIGKAVGSIDSTST